MQKIEQAGLTPRAFGQDQHALALPGRLRQMRFELHQRVGRATQRRDGGHGRQFGKGFGVALGRWADG